MFPWTKILRFGALTFAGVVVVGCMLLLSAYAILQTDAGRASLVSFLNVPFEYRPDGMASR